MSACIETVGEPVCWQLVGKSPETLMEKSHLPSPTLVWLVCHSSGCWWSWWCRFEACVLLHNILIQALVWARCLIIYATGGGGTAILFSTYLDIYCSTECNIMVEKPDPKHTNSTIPLSPCPSSLVLSPSSITSQPTPKVSPISLITNRLITQWNKAVQQSTIVLSAHGKHCICLCLNGITWFFALGDNKNHRIFWRQQWWEVSSLIATFYMFVLES